MHIFGLFGCVPALIDPIAGILIYCADYCYFVISHAAKDANEELERIVVSDRINLK
jgi:hypothetical protein